MVLKSSVLCPIDFSDSSRGAMRYAGAIAVHAESPLTLLAVNDALLDEAAELTGGRSQLADDTRREMEKVRSQAFGERPGGPDVQFEVASGKPAPEDPDASHVSAVPD